MTGLSPDLQKLFDDARLAASVEDVAGGKMKRSGKELRGACPVSGCGEKSDSPPFVIQPGLQRWKCYVCQPRWGDVIDLEHRLRSSAGETMVDAARRLLGGEARADNAETRERRARRRAEEEKAALESEAWKAALAVRIWREASPAAGTLVQTYLEARGLFGPVLARMLAQLRFHPNCYYGGHPEFGAFLPAMVALPMTPFGPPGGVHCTYLAPSGKTKAKRDPAKKMWGPQGMVVDGRAWPGGVWLTRPDAEGPLVDGEGIETTGAAAILLAGPMQAPMRAVAALSLDKLQGGEIIDNDGCRDVWTPKGDPERPPFLWPEDPAHPWGQVIVAVDRDMKPIKVKGRTGRGRPVDYERDQQARADLCARLATAAWRGSLAEGSGTTVRAAQPRPGFDFSDELKAVLAERGGVLA